MSDYTIENLEYKIADLIAANEAQSQALAKRKEDIDKLTNELDAMKNTCVLQQGKLNWLIPMASMAVMHIQRNAESRHVDYALDDILSQIRSLR